MKRIFLKVCAVLFWFLLLSFSVYTQTAPRKILTDADVKKILTDLQPMVEEFDNLELENEPAAGEENAVTSMIAALRASEEARQIIRRYGWDDRFFEKFSAFMNGFIIISMEISEAESYSYFDTAIEQIQSNPDLTNQQKDEMIKQLEDSWDGQMASQNEYMAGMKAAYEKNVHPDDTALIRKYKADILAMFESAGE